MLPYRLVCLGPPQLVGPDGEPIHLKTRKHLALLIWLTLEPPRPHSRDRLAELFWPHSDSDDARHSLVVALSVLRGKVSRDAFETTRNTIKLLPNFIVTDTAALEGNDQAEADSTPIAPFLEDFEIPGAPDFDHWVDCERSRLFPILQHHLAQRIDRCRETGDSKMMGRVATQLQRVDPLSEPAIRAVMESQAMSGERLAALRSYENWTRRLDTDLGATPSLDIERLAQRLRRGSITGPSKIPFPVITGRWKRVIFVGRKQEFEQGYKVWGRVRAGEAAHLLVRGENGIGKTMLAERLAMSIALEGASVARVQCYELERELPFGMIGTLVNKLLDMPGASGTSPQQLAELGRLVTRVHEHWTNLPEPSTHTGEEARILFTEAVIALLEAIAHEQPVVVIVDDLHLADATSIAVLHLIMRRLEDCPIMVILTAAKDDDAIPHVARKFAEHPESVRISPLQLGPLRPIEAGELLDEVIAETPDPGPTIRKTLLAGAHGNPMILGLLADDWKRSGDSSLVLSMTAMALGEPSYSERAFKRLIDGTLGTLNPETRSVLDLGAILGNRLNDLSMYSLVDVPLVHTMQAMGSLTSQRLLRDAGTHLEFANEVIRVHCYRSMATPVRRMLHSLVADKLLTEVGADEPVPGLEVAWHLVRGNRLSEAVPYLLAGGRESIRRGAPHEADLALSTGLPALQGTAQRKAVLLLAEALQELGRWQDSIQTLRLMTSGSTAEEYEAAEVWRSSAVIEQELSGKESLRQTTQWLTEVVAYSGSLGNRVQAATVAVKWLNELRSPELIKDLREALDTVPTGLLDAYQNLQLDLARAWVTSLLGRNTEALSWLKSAVELAKSNSYSSSIAVRLRIGCANTCSILGRYAEAVPLSKEAYRLASKLDNITLLSSSAAQLSMAYGRQFNLKEQIYWARCGMEHNRALPWTPTTIALAYELGMGLALSGQSGAAQEAIDTLLGNMPVSPHNWMIQGASLMAADIAATTGQSKKALRLAAPGVVVGFADESYTGLVARWKALTAIAGSNEMEVLQELKTRRAGWSTIHSKDRVELGAAIATLEDQIEGVQSDRWNEVLAGLAELPKGVSIALRAVGMLPERLDWSRGMKN